MATGVFWTASALDVVHPEGKGKRYGYGYGHRSLQTEHMYCTHMLFFKECVCILFYFSMRMHFFRNICKPDNCLHDLLPPQRDLAVTSRLRKPTVYPRPSLRTKRYCSAVSYALLNFQ